MRNRREFLKDFAGTSAGAALLSRESLLRAAYRLPQVPQAAPPAAAAGGAVKRREIAVGGKGVKTVDGHCHVTIPEVVEFFKDTPLENTAARAVKDGAPEATMLGPNRLARMDQEGIDV